MIVEKKDFTVDGTRVVILYVEGLIKLGESAEFFLYAFRTKTIWDSNVVVDIEQIDYIDSTGVGEFVGVCVALARHGRNFVLLQPLDAYGGTNGRVERYIRIAGAVDDLRLIRTKNEAIAAVITPRKTTTPSVEGEPAA